MQRARADEEYGADWSHLSDIEKDETEERFFSKVFAFLSEHEGAEFEVELPLPEERSRFAALLSVEAHVDDGRRVIRGRLTPDVGRQLAKTNPVTLTVKLEGAETLSLHDAWTGVIVSLSESEANMLKQRLQGDP